MNSKTLLLQQLVIWILFKERLSTSTTISANTTKLNTDATTSTDRMQTTDYSQTRPSTSAENTTDSTTVLNTTNGSLLSSTDSTVTSSPSDITDKGVGFTTESYNSSFSTTSLNEVNKETSVVLSINTSDTATYVTGFSITDPDKISASTVMTDFQNASLFSSISTSSFSAEENTTPKSTEKSLFTTTSYTTDVPSISDAFKTTSTDANINSNTSPIDLDVMTSTNVMAKTESKTPGSELLSTSPSLVSVSLTQTSVIRTSKSTSDSGTTNFSTAQGRSSASSSELIHTNGTTASFISMISSRSSDKHTSQPVALISTTIMNSLQTTGSNNPRQSTGSVIRTSESAWGSSITSGSTAQGKSSAAVVHTNSPSTSVISAISSRSSDKHTTQSVALISTSNKIPSSTMLSTMINSLQTRNSNNPQTSTDSGLPHSTILPSGLPHSTTLPSGLPHSTTLPSGLPQSTTLPSGLPQSTTLPSGLPHSTTLSVSEPDSESTTTTTTLSPYGSTGIYNKSSSAVFVYVMIVILTL